MPLAVSLSDLPTPTQLLELAAIIPKTAPPITPVYILLQPFLTLLKTPWIFNFLFTTAPIHINHLTSPTLSSNAFICSLIATRAENVPFMHRPGTALPETNHFRSRYLFTPAFTLDTLTAGFSVIDCSTHYISPKSIPSWYIGCSQTLIGRFIHDYATSSTYFIYDAADSNLILVFCTTFQSSTRTRSVTTVFKRDELNPIVTDATTFPSFQSILPTLVFCHHEDQTHKCTICQASASTNCTCVFPTSKAAHPFDIPNFHQSMSLHLGARQSIASKSTFHRGLFHRRVLLGSRQIMQALSDPSFVRLTASLAVGKHFRSNLPDPRHSNLLIDFADLVSPNEIEVKLYSNLSESTSKHMGYTDNGRITQNDELNATWRETVIEDDTFVSGENTFEILGRESMSNAIDRIAEKRNTDEEEDWWSNQQPLAPPIEDRRNHSDDVLEDSRPRITTSVVKAAVPRREAIRKMPGTSDGSYIEIGKSDQASDLTERRRKARKRRERNRAAARRSNQKRKEYRETLIMQVREMHEKMEDLRRKEILLRQENCKLRHSSNVGSQLFNSGRDSDKFGIKFVQNAV